MSQELKKTNINFQLNTLVFLKKGNKWGTQFWFCRLLFSILHVTAHVLPLMLYVLCCLRAMYALLFCCSLKEWNSGPLEVQLSFANGQDFAFSGDDFWFLPEATCEVPQHISVFLVLFAFEYFCCICNMVVFCCWLFCWCWGFVVVVWFLFYGWQKFGFSFNYFYNNIWGISLVLEGEDKVVFLECMFSTAC